MLSYLMTEFYWVGVIIAAIVVFAFNSIRRYGFGHDKQLWTLLLYFLAFLSWYLFALTIVLLALYIVYWFISWIIISFRTGFLHKDD